MKWMWTAVSFLLLATTACRRGPEGDPSGDAQKPVRIGSILSLSGTLANYGELEKRGFELAQRHINEEGGIDGRPLEILFEDSELDPKKAISAYNKLTAVDKVPMIAGAVGSSVCLALAPLATRDRVVVMSAGASSPKLTGASPYFFRVAPSDTLGAARLVDWVLAEGHQRIALLAIENDYGVGQRDVALRRLEEKGRKSVLVESVLPEASDLRPQIERIRKAKPDAVLLLTHAPEAGYFLKQAKEAGFAVRTYGGDALTDPAILEIAGAAAEGARYLLPARGAGPLYEKYATAYREAYKAEPEALGLKAYALAQVAAAALRNAEYKGQALQTYLSAMPDLDTAMGQVRFDQGGDIMKIRFDRLEYRNGKATVIGTDEL
ncbi:MAG TPA: ABC transporter substrate-binding protein [Thermoanaerobaculia bacterium]|nr:ABC transporter substrate-binding protein [Thermoanaerobaculia bacterium]